MSDPFLGQIVLFAGNFAPRSWAFCDGQLLPISSYSALYSLLGTFYGGDGVSTFALPDLRGRVAIHAGTGPGLSPRALGSRGGQATVTLTPAQMPAHTHAPSAAATSDDADSMGPASRRFAKAEEVTYGPATASRVVPMGTAAVSSAGSGQAHPNRSPYLGVNYIIALQGVFPSRT